MDAFFPFIHKIEKKKDEELQPLYVELEPPPPQYKEKEESEDSPRIVIIQL